MEDKGVGCTTDGRCLPEVYVDSQIRDSLCLQDEEGRLVPSLTEKAAPPLIWWPEGLIREGETKNEPTSQGCCGDQSQNLLSTWYSLQSAYFDHHAGKMPPEATLPKARWAS